MSALVRLSTASPADHLQYGLHPCINTATSLEGCCCSLAASAIDPVLTSMPVVMSSASCHKTVCLLTISGGKTSGQWAFARLVLRDQRNINKSKARCLASPYLLATAVFLSVFSVHRALELDHIAIATEHVVFKESHDLSVTHAVDFTRAASVWSAHTRLTANPNR